MSYLGQDPAGPFEKCPDCGEDADMYHSPERCAENRTSRPCIDCGQPAFNHRLCNRCFVMVKL